MKKLVLLIALLVIIGIAVFLFWPKEETKETKKITEINENLTEDQVIDNVLITDISLTSKESGSVFSAKLQNLTANALSYNNLTITIKNKNDKVLASLVTYFGGVLNPEETKIATAQTNLNLAEADTLEFTFN